MGLLAKLIPPLTLLIVGLASVLPWGLGNELRFCLPASAFVVVYFWQAGHPGLMPPVLVASVGLAIDALTYGPLGYWPLIFLAGMAVARAANRVLEGAGRAGVWLAFVAASLGLAVVAWLTASAYFFQMVDWRPMALTVAIQALAYPMLAALLAPLERIVAGPRVLNLGRRGP